jgi:hypothetical protein
MTTPPCLYNVQNKNEEQTLNMGPVLKLQLPHKLSCNSKIFVMPYFFSF